MREGTDTVGLCRGARESTVEQHCGKFKAFILRKYPGTFLSKYDISDLAVHITGSSEYKVTPVGVTVLPKLKWRIKKPLLLTAILQSESQEANPTLDQQYHSASANKGNVTQGGNTCS